MTVHTVYAHWGNNFLAQRFLTLIGAHHRQRKAIPSRCAAIHHGIPVMMREMSPPFEVLFLPPSGEASTTLRSIAITSVLLLST